MERAGAPRDFGAVESRHPPIHHEHGDRGARQRMERLFASRVRVDAIPCLEERVGAQLPDAWIVVDDGDHRAVSARLVKPGIDCHDHGATIALGPPPLEGGDGGTLRGFLFLGMPHDEDYNQLVEYRQRKSTKDKSVRRPPDPAFGERLAAARRQAGFTQSELASRAGVTLNSVWRYETGRRPEDYDVLARLAEAVGASVDFLLRGGGPSSFGVAEESRAWDAALRPLLASTNLRLAAHGKMGARLNRAWRKLPEVRKEEVRTLVRRAAALAAAVEHLLPEASARAVNKELSAELTATIISRILERA